jgi:hypothetical protein
MPVNRQAILTPSLTTIAADGNEANLITIYNHLRSFESDYDRAQSTLRTIASAWILAAIGALGLLIQGEYSSSATLSPESAAPLRQALLFVAALGLTSLWFLDLRVYQRLLHAIYSLGCHIELNTNKVLPIRSRTYLLNYDITRSLSWFYRAPLLVLFFAAITSWLQAAFGLHSLVSMLLTHQPAAWRPTQIWQLSSIITAVHILFFFWISHRAEQWSTLDDQIPAELVALRQNP